MLANDRDPEGEVLTLAGASVANPSQGSVSVNADGTLQFMPAAGFSGIATINYVVADSSGASSTGSATVNVGTNTPPTGRDATLVLPEDSSRAFTPRRFRICGFRRWPVLRQRANRFIASDGFPQV